MTDVVPIYLRGLSTSSLPLPECGGGTFHVCTTGTFRVPTKMICLCIFLSTSHSDLGCNGHVFF